MAENDNINLEITEAIVEAVSPTATVSKVGDTATITVTDKNGTTTASVKDGDKGDKGDQGDKGDKGDKGDTGNTGATGATPELSIGTVSTLGPGEPATATITGTDEQPVLSLGIPKGAKGDTGNTGAAAGFGTVSASVDANIGTPAVSVTASGPNTAKNIAFAFSNLKGAKGDTGATGNGIASIEETATSGSVHTYTITYTDGNTTTFDVTDGEVTNATLATILEDYAKIDGAYESMTVGNAEQLISSVTVNDKVPYNFRTSGGSIDIGNREVDKLVGGTVAWNQIINGNFSATSYWTPSKGTIAVADNVLTFTLTDVPTSTWDAKIQQSLFDYMKTNDKILLAGTLSPSITAGLQVALTNATAGNNPYYGTTIPANTWKREEMILNVNNGSHHFAQVYLNTDYANWQVGDSFKVKDFIAINLTRMFGETIANYVYTLETATAGAGVAWFKKLFPKDYYAYNAGQLMSVKTSAHQMVGFNQWDEEWELGYYNVTTGEPATSSQNLRSKNFIPVVSNTSYYAKIPTGYIAICEYDADKNFIKCTQGIANSGITTTDDTHFIRFHCTSAYGTTYNHDICINLHWDGERDGDYEAYKKWTYPLDSDLELRGMPKLDSANNLYYDGDTYEDDGTVTRKYGIVDLGTLTYEYRSNHRSGLFSTYGLNNYKISSNVFFICDSYRSAGTVLSVGDMSQKSNGDIGLYVNSQYPTTIALYVINEQYTDATTFKNAMSGVYLVYELATQTTETADPYQNPQIVDDFGTEEYVDERTVAIPVGHDTEYMNNLKAKLEMAPDSPDGDGDYVLRQTNGENSYVPLMKELPSTPSEDGTYILKCTVASGVATLGWVEEE